MDFNDYLEDLFRQLKLENNVAYLTSGRIVIPWSDWNTPYF